ncbi:AraC family transcriptional regulator [Bradyrhizobium sp. SK17]|uniref:helix-turn-helix domain-containing protein n=1 Tax=Bradyrhizobium sp. SK17 TaxID=2057741 RepID=UPI000C312434|nr:AraC family transcriptional regulator [Bradyrhizobium sp. SK17]AUC99124.1 AraC family transcriptional regulator [Bradyrhizobium sp. SK17]
MSNAISTSSSQWQEGRFPASITAVAQQLDPWNDDLGLTEEIQWREADSPEGHCQIKASRWVADRGSPRNAHSVTPDHCHIVSVAIKPSRVRLAAGSEIISEGLMAPGTVHVSAPGQRLTARFSPPFDFLHFYVDNQFLIEQRLIHDGTSEGRPASPFRDPLAEKCGRSLLDFGEYCHPEYVASISKAIVVRALTHQQGNRTCGGLPKWRLQRLERYLADNIGGQVSLQNMANAAGLSRMHFAAQFRATTGFKPHEYLLLKRVEQAKIVMMETKMPLVEVALSVGFSAQAQFSTVFKRFTGQSPARWKQEFQSATA